MNIVLCTNKLADGGAERVVSLWAKGFVNLGYKVSIILRSSQTKVQYELPPNVELYYLNVKEKGRICAFVNRIIKLRFLLDKINPDYVITALSPWGLWAYLASFGRKREIINTEHNTFERPASAPMTLHIYFYKYVVNKLFPFVTVLTKEDKKIIGKRLNNIVVLPNPLPFEVLAEVPQKKKVVLAVGRIDAWHVKGFDMLIKAWNVVGKEFPDWELQIFGPGEQENVDYLASLLDKNVDNVMFMGQTFNIKQIYQYASILVSSSRYEGFGMAIIEAMSQGCACVVSDYRSRQREIIRDYSEGLICKADDVMSLMDGIRRMIVNDNYRMTVQKNSLSRAKYYSLNRIMTIWKSLLIKQQ